MSNLNLTWILEIYSISAFITLKLPFFISPCQETFKSLLSSVLQADLFKANSELCLQNRDNLCLYCDTSDGVSRQIINNKIKCIFGFTLQITCWYWQCPWPFPFRPQCSMVFPSRNLLYLKVIVESILWQVKVHKVDAMWVFSNCLLQSYM